jgi:hypothetical protein
MWDALQASKIETPEGTVTGRPLMLSVMSPFPSGLNCGRFFVVRAQLCPEIPASAEGRKVDRNAG